MAKLLDFGLVKTANKPGRTDLTQFGEIIGTPPFMSPEQAMGQNVDARTDIYSLGAVAYFMLGGSPPFVRDSVVETLNAHICDPLVPLEQIRSDIDQHLIDVVHCCLAKDPGRRFESAMDLAESLASS
jgi:serine/threonine-protein kinase